MRHDDNSVYGGNTTGRLGSRHEVLRGLKLRALAGTTFRAPTFNDLFYPGYGVATVAARARPQRRGRRRLAARRRASRRHRLPQPGDTT